MQILKPVAAADPYVVFTTWENKQAFEDWVQSEDFKLAHQNPMPKEAFNGEGKLEQYQIIIAAEAP